MRVIIIIIIILYLSLLFIIIFLFDYYFYYYSSNQYIQQDYLNVGYILDKGKFVNVVLIMDYNILVTLCVFQILHHLLFDPLISLPLHYIYLIYY
eukprot:UN08734